MPPWVASVPRKMPLLHGRAIERLPFAFRCHNARNSPSLWLSNLLVRSASTHVSPTAINLRPNIPPKNKELYDALSALSGAAETYVNISRLQLALHGLAAHDAVTRVAGRLCALIECGLGLIMDDSTRAKQPSERATPCAAAARRSSRW